MNSLTPYNSYCSTRSLRLSTHPVWVEARLTGYAAPKPKGCHSTHPCVGGSYDCLAMRNQSSAYSSSHPVWVEARLSGYAPPKPAFPCAESE